MTTQTMTHHGASTHSMDHAGEHAHTSHYMKLAVMVGLSFIYMYALMYAMVNTFSDVFNNVNQFYMAGLMAAPMAIVELVLMKSMYQNKKMNMTIYAVSALATLLFWFGIRSQTGVGDSQFVRSMIPHHSGAILMCQEANILDPELKTLCGQIVKGQQEEIDQMRKISERLK